MATGAVLRAVHLYIRYMYMHMYVRVVEYGVAADVVGRCIGTRKTIRE